MNSVLKGTTNLSVTFSASDAAQLVQQVDLFSDGKLLQTMTNVAASAGNILKVTVNNWAMSYAVPAGASIQSVALGLTDLINTPANTNATKILALLHGDRIELQSTDLSNPGSQIQLSATNEIGSAAGLTTFISSSHPQFLDTIASGLRGFAISGPTLTNSFVQLLVTKGGATQLNFGVTNTDNVTLTNLTKITQQLISLINSSPALQGPDGLTAGDFITDNPGPDPPEQVEFYLHANSLGWNAAEQIAVVLSTSTNFTIFPEPSGYLDANLFDLRPRNHLYITAGVSNLSVTFPLDTTSLIDGWHELTAVAYEGSHVRTQQRVSQIVQIQNGQLAASFDLLYGGTNTDLAATLKFGVTANDNHISSIQLFSTGGALATISNQASVSFSVPATNLDIGLHPFYAVVVSESGSQYRTETKWVRILGPEPTFSVVLTAPPATLSWNATVGRRYDVLASTNLSGPFQLATSLIASNSIQQWADTNQLLSQRFYRIAPSNPTDEHNSSDNVETGKTVEINRNRLISR
jgi:hypothetical protein